MKVTMCYFFIGTGCYL